MTDAAPPRILIVEDEAILAMDLQLTLQELGFEVVGIRANAKAAVETALAEAPDLVLMDIRLQGDQDGIDAAEEIRRESGTPVVYLTSHDDPGTLRRAAATDPYGYLIKPAKRSAVQTAVEIALRRRALERSLDEQRSWAQATLSAIGEGVIRLDLQGRITFLNESARDLLALPMEHLLGRPLSEVLLLDRPELPVDKVLAMVLQEQSTVQGPPGALKSRPGTPRVVSETASPVVLNGDSKGAVLVLRDLTRQQLLERRVEVLDRLASLGTLAAGVAHEINNPLTVLNAELGILQTELQDPVIRASMHSEQRVLVEEVLENLQAATRQIVQVGHDLAVFSHPERQPERCQLERTLGWALRLSRGENQLLPQVDIDLPLDIQLRIPELRLAQVLSNLLVNAMHAMDHLPSSERRIRIQGLIQDGVLLMDISDSGPGIPKDLQDAVFEPFLTTKADKGTGLGLPLSRSLLAKSGGTLELLHSGEAGTTFRLRLPLAER